MNGATHNASNRKAPAAQQTHVNGKAKKKPEAPLDPATMYESLKNRIAALEEEEVLEEEEERRFGSTCPI